MLQKSIDNSQQQNNIIDRFACRARKIPFPVLLFATRFWPFGEAMHFILMECTAARQTTQHALHRRRKLLFPVNHRKKAYGERGKSRW